VRGVDGSPHQGDRVPETAGEQSDDAVWKLWQAAKLDARQFGIWRKAYSRSVAYVTVGVDPRKPRTPRVTIEGPENVIVETDPADASRRLAALRLWHDSLAKRWMATLYLPGTRYHWRSRKEYVARDPRRTAARSGLGPRRGGWACSAITKGRLIWPCAIDEGRASLARRRRRCRRRHRWRERRCDLSFLGSWSEPGSAPWRRSDRIGGHPSI